MTSLFSMEMEVQLMQALWIGKAVCSYDGGVWFLGHAVQRRALRSDGKIVDVQDLHWYTLYSCKEQDNE